MYLFEGCPGKSERRTILPPEFFTWGGININKLKEQIGKKRKKEEERKAKEDRKEKRTEEERARGESLIYKFRAGNTFMVPPRMTKVLLTNVPPLVAFYER